MKQKESISIPAFGGSSLLVIFAVLCLIVFALLSLSTAQAERRLADAVAGAVTEYYAADLQAQEIFARLQSGENIDGVQRSGDRYDYCCRISENQVLEVAVEKTEAGWDVLRWQVVAGADQSSKTLPVWDGK